MNAVTRAPAGQIQRGAPFKAEVALAGLHIAFMAAQMLADSRI